MKRDACENCGGSVLSRKARVDHRWKGRLIVVEGVPVGVCRRCGERYYDAAVLRRLDFMARDKRVGARRILVPVADYAPADASHGTF